MSFLAVIFAATDPELDRAFPGWRRALARPVKCTLWNPATKMLHAGDSWDPADVGRTTPKKLNDDEDWLPHELGELPQVVMKNLFDHQLDLVFEILAGEEQPKPRAALFSGGRPVSALPPTALPLLASLTEADLARKGKALSDGGFFSSHGWSEKICAGLLGQLRSVAKQAQTTGRKLYVCYE